MKVLVNRLVALTSSSIWVIWPRAGASPAFIYGAAIHGATWRAAYAVQVVVEAIDEPDFAYAILETIRRWRFQAGELDGEPVPVLYGVTVNFRMR